MTIRELLEKRAQLIAEARQIQDKADAEKRELTDEESGNFDKYLKDAEGLQKDAEKRQLLEDAENVEIRQTSEPPEVSEPEPAESRQDPRAEERRMQAFETALVHGSDTRGWPAEQRALQADLDISGGYTVAPPQFISQLIQAVDNLVFMQNLATVIPVTSSDKIEGVSLDNDPADPAWTAEIGALSEDSTMGFGARALEPNQLTKLLKASDKLLMTSAIPVASLINQRLAYKFSVTAENVYLNGTGAGQPLGVFTESSQGISSSRDVSEGNSTTAFTFDGLKEAKYSLKAQYWPRLNWILHRDAVKMAAKLKDGEGQYQWQASVVGGEPDRLLGFPVRMSEYAPSTFTTGLYVGILGDFSLYWIAMLQQVMFKRLDELYAGNSQTGFVGKMWFDGMPVLEEGFARVTLA